MFGTLPTEIGLLTRMNTELWFASSSFTGTLPTELGKLLLMTGMCALLPLPIFPLPAPAPTPFLFLALLCNSPVFHTLAQPRTAIDYLTPT